MKIVLAHKFFHVTGGAEVFFFEVGRVLESKGHEVAYFSTNSPNNLASDFSSYFIDHPDYKNGSLLSRSMGIAKIIYSLDAKKSFAQLVDDFKPDIIHVFAIQTHLSPSILDAGRTRNIPIVMSCNDYKHICPNYKLFHHGRICEECKGGKFFNAIKNKCCKNSFIFSVASAVESYAHNSLDIYRKNVNKFLFASQFMAKKTSEFWGDDSFEWDILRNPFDVKKHAIESKRGNYFLYFGRIIDEKGVDTIIDAAILAPEIEIIIVGDGPDQEILQRRVQTANLHNINFLGVKWGDDLNDILSKCRCVIVPSLWHENFPYVILQAFAASKPVIGSNRGGIPEMIMDGQHGLVYEANDSTALLNAMQVIVSNEDDAISMGNRARSYVEKEFNDDAFYKQLIGIYESVVL